MRVLLLVLALFVLCPAARGEEPGWRGLPLAEALERLREAGLKVVFTSELVRPEMHVEAEPQASPEAAPRQLLAELLAPHGLRVTEFEGGLLVVVLAPDNLPPEPPSLPPPAVPPVFSEEIVVRASQVSLLEEAPTAPFALSRSAMEAMSYLAEDVFRALSLLPGVTGNDLSAQFHVRGGRRDEVKVVLDGHELIEAYHLPDFDRALSLVPASGLEAASVTAGTLPAAHGDRLGGVLDLKTMEPLGRAEGQLAFSMVSVSGQLGGTAPAEDRRWLVSARRSATELATAFLADERPTFWDVFAKGTHAPAASRHSWRGSVLVAADRLETKEVGDGDFKNFANQYRSSYVWLTHEALWGARFSTETRAAWSQVHRDRKGLEDEAEQRFEIRDRRDTFLLNLAQTWRWQSEGSHTLETGWEARRYETDYDYTNDLEPDFVVVSPRVTARANLTRFKGEASGHHLSAFVSDRFSPGERVTVEAGVRFDHHSLISEALWSPRLHLAWRLSEQSVWRAGWGRYHQSQRPSELAVEDGETRFQRAERSDQWQVGWERVFTTRPRAPIAALRIEAYHRAIDHPRPRYENLFEASNTFPEAEPDRVRIAPIRSRADGIEVLLRGHLRTRSEWWVSYTRSQARDELAGLRIPRQVDQPHAVSAYLHTQVGNHWDLSLAWRFHSGWPSSALELNRTTDEEGEAEFVPVLTSLFGKRLPSYHRLDLRARREWSLSRGRLVVHLDLQNVYSRANVAGFDVALEEDEGRLAVERESWPGLFPSLGISWEF